MSVFTVLAPESSEIMDFERRLTRQLATCGLPVDDAVVLQWPSDRAVPRSRRMLNVPCLRPRAAEFWSLLFGIAFRLPRIGADGPPTELRMVGITPEIVLRLREHLVPGTAAVFLLTGQAILARLRHLSTSFLLEVDLTPDEDALLDKAFRP